MAESRIDQWAKTLVNYCVRAQAGESVAIMGGVAAEPLMRSVYKEVTRAGAFPVVLPTFSGLSGDLLRKGNDDQLSFITPIEEFVRTTTDCLIVIQAETNTKSLASVDPARQQFFQSKRAHLFERYLERSAAGELKWVLTLFPTDAFAQDAGLSTDEFTEFVYTACKLGDGDPVAAWKSLAEEGARVIAFLNGKTQLRLTAPGTDLTVDITGRIWENSDGLMNFPDGEIFTGPVETGTTGVVTFSYPVVTAGREIEGIVLTFANGRVVEATASRGEDYLNAVLNTDEGARVLGEFAIGTNYDIQRFSKNILFDEKIGGTVHMAIGSGYPETGSVNKSAVHWDMICDLRDGGELTADGELLMKDGRFVV